MIKKKKHYVVHSVSGRYCIGCVLWEVCSSSKAIKEALSVMKHTGHFAYPECVVA